MSLTLAEALAAPRIEGTFKLSNYDYELFCDVCKGYLVAKDRAALVASRAPHTLCPDHFGAWLARQEERDLEARYARDAVDGPLVCKECGTRYRYRYDSFARTSDGSTPSNCRKCGPIVRERREAERQARREQKARELAATPRKTRYHGPGRLAYVYRLFDADGALLYVGKTYSVSARLFTGETAHSKTKKWFSRVASVRVAAYKSDADALEAEAWAIQREAPRFNVAQPKPRKPRVPRKIAAYEGAL
ncbi:G-I-Y Y-I-G endonuclease [Arthrobacter phage Amyev]|uniref:G-I-Y Y-I-G endonuclease n=1 Tax=Arthrobacter phage Amyev TaxID=2832315 RepID=A0AA48Y3U7_9CAUD|nr:endonuclease [Arthrobacter phage Amyev]UIW13460.1 G-I-Y Y-I-G endonuclease [Arthrobacter phage Amyev]